MSAAEAQPKHTPGPWSIENPFGDDSITIVANGDLGTPDWIIVADAYIDNEAPFDITKTQAEANARLIAAAPELLEACKALLHFNEELCADVGVSKHYPSAERARKAIAKAEGQR